jgi:ribonuclease Z
MRVSFVGSCPFPPRRDQAGTCIMVELGNGDRFFFDFGPGCVKNILAMGVPVQEINDIFITHLHVDHYHDLSYLLPFSAWGGRWKQPLRVTGPSGRTERLGTKAMVAGMKQMLRWHLEAFDSCPIGDGYEVEVNEFDWKDENGICYQKNGVTIRHWRRSHTKDGASAYRLDWNGLSFVWTGDGRPDELTTKYAAGADVFVTESQPDLARLNLYKYGLPEFLYNYTIDIHHTPTYAAGYLMKQVNPRVEDDHPYCVRQRDQRRHPRPLGRVVPLRRTGCGGAERDQGRGLAPRGCAARVRGSVLPQPEASIRRPVAVRHR